MRYPRSERRILAPDRRLDVHYLRLDQTGVELPGQAFDIDDLVTDGIEFTFASLDQAFFDKTELELWYNRRKFNGDAQRPRKRCIFVIYGPKYLNFSGTTDVDSTVAGFTWATTWGQENCAQRPSALIRDTWNRS